MPTADLLPAGWTAIVPVKSTSSGKSRIDLPPQDRGQVAAAMAIDTVTAVAGSAVGDVLVAIDDPADAAWFAALPRVCTLRVRARGLNAAIDEAAATVAGPVVCLPGDLPWLTSAAVDDVLIALAEALHDFPRAVVADESGSGTTFLAARSAAELRPAYGEGSFARHGDAATTVVDLPASHPARRDVDTLAELLTVTTGRTGEVVAALHGR